MMKNNEYAIILQEDCDFNNIFVVEEEEEFTKICASFWSQNANKIESFDRLIRWYEHNSQKILFSENIDKYDQTLWTRTLLGK